MCQRRIQCTIEKVGRCRDNAYADSKVPPGALVLIHQHITKIIIKNPISLLAWDPISLFHMASFHYIFLTFSFSFTSIFFFVMQTLIAYIGWEKKKTFVKHDPWDTNNQIIRPCRGGQPTSFNPRGPFFF